MLPLHQSYMVAEEGVEPIAYGLRAANLETTACIPFIPFDNIILACSDGRRVAPPGPFTYSSVFAIASASVGAASARELYQPPPSAGTTTTGQTLARTTSSQTLPRSQPSGPFLR